MANEWQSLLQQAPNMANLNLVRTAQDAYGTAQDQKIKAYDQYRLQKAQEIASKATRADGTMDWDAMFKLGSEAGIGLDTFNQVHKMQTERAQAEVARAQNRMQLESMGYDPTQWDPSQGTIADKTYREQYGRDAQPVPFTPPTAEEARAYDFLTAPPAETQIPQAAPTVFGTQGVGETAQTSMPSSAPVQAAPQDVVPAQNEVIITPNAIPSSGTFTLPEPPMPERQVAKTEGYYNELWRAQRDPEAMKRLLGAGVSVGATGTGLSVSNMKPDEIQNLGRYLALRGIQSTNPQEGLTALENMALQSVAQPVLNPMIGMLSKDEQAKEWGRYNQALAEYPAKVQEARVKLSDAIRTGNYDVLDKQISVEQNKRAREQVEWPEVFAKPFETPSEKANARQASASAQGIKDAIEKLKGISANDPRFPAVRMAVAKDIMIAYGLPVTEGVMQELEGLVRNGVSASEISDRLSREGFGAAAANALSQTATQVLGLKDPQTIAEMGRSAQEFAHRKYKALGVSNSKAFNIAFPVSEATKWQDESPATVLPSAPRPTQPAKPSQTPATKGKPLSGVSF